MANNRAAYGASGCTPRVAQRQPDPAVHAQFEPTRWLPLLRLLAGPNGAVLETHMLRLRHQLHPNICRWSGGRETGLCGTHPLAASDPAGTGPRSWATPVRRAELRPTPAPRPIRWVHQQNQSSPTWCAQRPPDRRRTHHRTCPLDQNGLGTKARMPSTLVADRS